MVVARVASIDLTLFQTLSLDKVAPSRFHLGKGIAFFRFIFLREELQTLKVKHILLLCNALR
jgi:hypothetical protein